MLLCLGISTQHLKNKFGMKEIVAKAHKLYSYIDRDDYIRRSIHRESFNRAGQGLHIEVVLLFCRSF